MAEPNSKLNDLIIRLEALQRKQEEFQRDFENLKREISTLKSDEKQEAPVTEERFGPQEVVVEKDATFDRRRIHEILNPINSNPDPGGNIEQTKHIFQKQKIDFEKLIGENLISKIGIAITIIGVSIGAKYSIEHDLISPMTRILLGYLMGIILTVTGICLKKNYLNFSAVLVSGAVAILYFITFAAYSYYSLMPQYMAFALMFVFTAFTVVAAVNYDKQIIAHIGFVGAYTIPILLSDDTGNITFLFSYMSIINLGILFVAFRKYWKPLFYSSFILTWLIYFIWFYNDYNVENHFVIALTFSFVFYAILYLTYLPYKWRKDETLRIDDVLLVVLNSFVYYGMGYAILDSHESGKHFLGLFTVFNALMHFLLSMAINRKKLVDSKLQHLILGLVLVFVTIAIPVQLDGNWVTLMWTAEAVLLFWLGRSKNVLIYEQLSYPLMLFSFISMFQDWSQGYNLAYDLDPKPMLVPLLNVYFLTSVFLIAGFAIILYIDRKSKDYHSIDIANRSSDVLFYLVPGAIVLAMYFAFYLEIANYWQQLYDASLIKVAEPSENFSRQYYNEDLMHFKNIWLNNFTILFVSLFSYYNIRKIKSQNLGLVNVVFITYSILVFCWVNLLLFSDLRENYLYPNLDEHHQHGVFNIIVRYISFLFVAFGLYAFSWYARQEFMQARLHKVFDLVLFISICWIISSELIHWMDMAASSQSYKLGLSILWGVYALLLIVLGIWKNKKHLRIFAIVLFTITLLKLFFYDISHLDTIAKTIVFVSLGILLLIISFLYNRYKDVITNENIK